MLAGYLGLDHEGFFEAFLSASPVIFQSMQDVGDTVKNSYLQIRLPKKNTKLGGHRIVYQVLDGTIRDAHKGLQSRLNRLYSVPDCVHGFVHGKSISSNAYAHLAKKVILKVDIRNFFESVTAAQVAMVFQKLGAAADISAALAKLVTLDGKLVQGFVTSPVIANLAVVAMDKELNTLCLANDFDYTRYADDITVSSNGATPDLKLVEPIINLHGFSLNQDKTLIMLRGKRQYVTGLTVFDDKYPRISKCVKRYVRQQLHYFKVYGAIDVMLHKKGLSWKDYNRDTDIQEWINAISMIDFTGIKGTIDFINAVEPDLATKLYQDFFDALSGRSDPVSDMLRQPYWK